MYYAPHFTGDEVSELKNSESVESVQTEKKELSAMRQRFNRAAQWIIYPLTAYVCLSQAAVFVNRMKNTLNPSVSRQAIRDEFGATVYGYESDVEKKKKGILSMIIEALRSEYPDGITPINSIEIVPEEVYSQRLQHQVNSVYTFLRGGEGLRGGYNENGTLYYFSCDDVNSANHIDFSVIRHEIMHSRLVEVLQKHPELLERWSELARDSNGNSYYESDKKRNFKSEDHLYPGSEMGSFQEKGFVDAGGMLNVYEDIVTLTTKAEIDINCFHNWLFGGEVTRGNSITLAKTKLAMEYGLLPPEYLDTVRLCNQLYEAVLPEGSSNESVANRVQKFSDFGCGILRESPDAKKGVLIHALMAHAFACQACNVKNKEEKMEYAQRAIAEVGTIFESPFVPSKEFLRAVLSVKIVCESVFNDEEGAQAALSAWDKYKELYVTDSFYSTYESMQDFLRDTDLNISEILERNTTPGGY